MTKLLTDWVKIGQSGPTVDGRDIDAQWLLDAAETYDPDQYTAVISVEHFHVWNFGSVAEVKAEQEGDCVGLYARLRPNKHLLERNADGQKLFTSMELAPNFAGTGKHYLMGLAITDRPASLGTHELHFSSRKAAAENHIVCGVELSALAMESAEERAMGFFRKGLSALIKGNKFSMDPAEAGEPTKPEEDSMDEKQFNSIMGKLDSLGKQADEFGSRLDALETKDAASEGDNKPGVEKDSDQMPDNFTKPQGCMDDIAAKFSAMSERMEKAVPGTAPGEATAPAGDNQEVL